MPSLKYFKNNRKKFNKWYAEYRKKNREKLNEYNRLWMREYRSRKKMQ